MSDAEAFKSEDEQQSGMSTAAKLIIGVVVAGCLGAVMCCGGVIWWGSQAISVTQDPDEIEEKLATIASIDMLDGWEPVMGMELNMMFEMQVAAYSPDETQESRMLLLMQMKMEGASDADLEMQMRMQMNQQGMNQEITIESSETRTFVIDGQERDFQFAVGADRNGNTVHQVTGVFRGRDGTAMLMMMEDDANWDEAAVEQMIESISAQ